eukprot:TRINITY_DN20562_c0_g1_i1.p1 TRINITY_DN20562_c0_g1~~TRINITY_DN20562_c0_g1_i1.p1  ORF type:complete len:453 (+),score=92.86 TRINITY_DN20562_c0_g1_i1:317-1675(+)
MPRSRAPGVGSEASDPKRTPTPQEASAVSSLPPPSPSGAAVSAASTDPTPVYGAGNPVKNPLRNARKKSKACDALVARVKELGPSCLDAGQKAKLEGHKRLLKEIAQLEKRCRAWEKKAKIDWKKAMKQDRSSIIGALLAEKHYRGSIGDKRVKGEGLILGAIHRGPLLIEAASDSDLQTIRNFLPKDFKFAEPAKRDPLHHDLLFAAGIVLPMAAYLYIPVEYFISMAVLKSAYNATLAVIEAVSFYLSVSHGFQWAIHGGSFLFCMICAWRGGEHEGLLMSSLRSLPSVSPMLLHFGVSVLFTLSAWMLLTLIPFVGPLLRDVVVHTFLPIQSVFSMLSTLGNGIYLPRGTRGVWTALLAIRALVVFSYGGYSPVREQSTACEGEVEVEAIALLLSQHKPFRIATTTPTHSPEHQTIHTARRHAVRHGCVCVCRGAPFSFVSIPSAQPVG